MGSENGEILKEDWMPKSTKKPRKLVEKDFYSEYPYNQPNERLYIEQAQYKEILLAFFDNLVDHLIKTGDHYRIPGNVGRIYIKKFRSNRTKLNYKAWKEGKFQLYTNYHTFGYSLKLKWDKQGARVKHLDYFKFTPVRKVSRKISKENQIHNYIHNYSE